MSMNLHVRDERLQEIAGGATPTRDEAQAIATDPQLRARLTAIDPTALFSILGVLETDPVPARPSVSAYRPIQRDASRPKSSSTGGRTHWRWLAGAAAASVAVWLVVMAWNTPTTPNGETQLATQDDAFPTATDPDELPFVERVDSPTAQVLSIPGADGVTITMIIDEGMEL